MARALLFQAKLPKKYWNYAVQHAVFLINRVPSKVLEYKIAYECLHGQMPDLSDLRTFDCLCFVSTHADPHKTKFDPRSTKCLFLGYKPGTEGYLVLDLKTYTIHVTRDTVFHELIFPYDTHTTASPWQYTSSSSPTHHQHELPPNSNSTPSTTNLTDLDPSQSTSPTQLTQPQLRPEHPHPRKSTRTTKPPFYLADYTCNSTSVTCIAHPLSEYHSYTHISPSHQNYIHSLQTLTEPSSFIEASKHDCWLEAMKAEIKALEDNHTWSIMDLPE